MDVADTDILERSILAYMDNAHKVAFPAYLVPCMGKTAWTDTVHIDTLVRTDTLVQTRKKVLPLLDSHIVE